MSEPEKVATISLDVNALLNFVLSDREFAHLKKKYSALKRRNVTNEDEKPEDANAQDNSAGAEAEIEPSILRAVFDKLTTMVRSGTRSYLVSYATMYACNLLKYALVAVKTNTPLISVIGLANTSDIRAISKFIATAVSVYPVFKDTLNSVLESVGPSVYEGKLAQKLSLNAEVLAEVISTALTTGLAYRFMPGSFPQSYVAVYFLVNALDYSVRVCMEKKKVKLPNWIGSWVLFPFAFSELFYTYIADPGSCPASFDKYFTRLLNGYFEAKPAYVHKDIVWPSTDEIVEAIRVVSKEKNDHYYSFVARRAYYKSPGIPKVEPLLRISNPEHKNYLTAFSHPSDASTSQTLLKYLLRKPLVLAKYFLPFYLFLGLAKEMKSLASAENKTERLKEIIKSAVKKSLRLILFLSVLGGSAINLTTVAPNIIPSNVFPKGRFRIIGFLVGLSSFILGNNTPLMLYAVRYAVLAVWSELRKVKRNLGPLNRSQFRDSYLFAASFAILAYLKASGNQQSIKSGIVMKTLNSIQQGNAFSFA